MPTIETAFWSELAQIQVESIGWSPLDKCAYLHLGSDVLIIEEGLPKPEMQGLSVLWRDRWVSK